jgi:hypothetical protein
LEVVTTVEAAVVSPAGSSTEGGFGESKGQRVKQLMLAAPIFSERRIAFGFKEVATSAGFLGASRSKVVTRWQRIEVTVSAGREIGPYFFQKAEYVAAEVVIVTDFFP